MFHSVKNSFVQSNLKSHCSRFPCGGMDGAAGLRQAASVTSAVS